MKVLNEATLKSGRYESGDTFVLIMDKKEAKTLVAIAEAAHLANKRRSSFRTWHKKIEDCMDCF